MDWLPAIGIAVGFSVAAFGLGVAFGFPIGFVGCIVYLILSALSGGTF